MPRTPIIWPTAPDPSRQTQTLGARGKRRPAPCNNGCFIAGPSWTNAPALANRLIALLKQYFPQALVLCGEDLWRPLATGFLLEWSSLQAVQKAKPATLKQFYYLNGSRSAKPWNNGWPS